MKYLVRNVQNYQMGRNVQLGRMVQEFWAETSFSGAEQSSWAETSSIPNPAGQFLYISNPAGQRADSIKRAGTSCSRESVWGGIIRVPYVASMWLCIYHEFV